MTIPWGDALGRHFRLREMVESRTARRDPEMWAAQENPPDYVLHNLERLVNLVLDPLRDAFDHPILVNSGYRCEALNAAVGGSPRSQHRLGQAADIRLAPGWTLEDAPAAIRNGRVRDLLPDNAPPMAFLFAELATEEDPRLEPSGGVVHLYPFDQLIHEYGVVPCAVVGARQHWSEASPAGDGRHAAATATSAPEATPSWPRPWCNWVPRPGRTAASALPAAARSWSTRHSCRGSSDVGAYRRRCESARCHPA